MKRILLILACLVVAIATPSIGQMIVGSPSGGSAAWYYPAGITDTSDNAETTSGWQESAYVYGGRIQAGATGTATKIAVKLSTSEATATGVKIGLYDDSNNLLAQCSTTAPSSTAWAECTISQSVTSGTYYRVFASTETNNFAHRYTTGQTGYYGTCAYSSAMCDPPASVGSEANGYAARMWIQ